MAAHIVAEEFLLVAEGVQLAPGFDSGCRGGGCRGFHGEVAEKRSLAAGAVALMRGRRRECGVDCGEERRAVGSEFVECAAFHKALEDFPVHGAGVQA